MSQSVSTIKPGRETDAAVARALGWMNILTSPLTGTLLGQPQDSVRNEPVPFYSTSEADALAALEATGKDYTHRKLNGRYLVWFASVPSEGVPFATFCLAASAAILAWAEGKGSSK